MCSASDKASASPLGLSATQYTTISLQHHVTTGPEGQTKPHLEKTQSNHRYFLENKMVLDSEPSTSAPSLHNSFFE